MGIFIEILEIIGTVAFAVSGALTGLKKNMDIFGVSILGLTTAVGGGVLRDIILGVTPPVVFIMPRYAAIAICISVIVFIPSARRLLTKNQALFECVLLIMDAVGLGVFTVAGIQAACTVSNNFNIFLLVFVGTITGVGGGVIRDVLSGSTPYIFVKHIYACASLAGALICSVLINRIGYTLSAAIGASLVIIIRLLAARYKWSLPKAQTVSINS